MKELRVTKYNPLKRDSSGAYLNEGEWTSFSEVGTSVSKEEYEKIEQAYIDSALNIVSDSELQLKGLEGDYDDPQLIEGGRVKGNGIEQVLRKLLREECWCRLESESAFIHVGWDYYMYVGASKIDESTLKMIEDRGLYPEDFTSPYHPELITK
ncbi:hypothetical protein ACWPKO_03105 [Coraliomargarita sp. W4R53]